MSSKILCVRIDRIGDLVLTLPADMPAIQHNWRVTWLINKGLRFVTDNAQPFREAHEIRREFSWSEFFSLIKWLEFEKFDRALIFHAPFWVDLAIWLAGVRWRAGRRSQWHSFLLRNKGVRQSRHDSSKSELIYNFDLAKNYFDSREIKPLQLKAPIVQVPLSVSDYVVVHPGMKGSARNWPADSYSKLVQKLSERAIVIVTGTNDDLAFSEQLNLHFSERVISLIGQLSSEQLLRVLSQAKLVVAPSTGIVHLAASLGVPTVGLYSPVQQQSPQRWGPQGVLAQALVPTVECPAVTHCLLERCPYFDCLKRLTVTDVLDVCLKFL